MYVNFLFAVNEFTVIQENPLASQRSAERTEMIMSDEFGPSLVSKGLRIPPSGLKVTRGRGGAICVAWIEMKKRTAKRSRAHPEKRLVRKSS